MGSEGAAFGRVVENARTGFTLKGETRRRRASIGVNATECDRVGAIRIKASESETKPRSSAEILLQI